MGLNPRWGRAGVVVRVVVVHPGRCWAGASGGSRTSSALCGSGGRCGKTLHWVGMGGWRMGLKEKW